jgi:hypothetical protein
MHSRAVLVVAIGIATGCAESPEQNQGLTVAIHPLPAAASMHYYSGMMTSERVVVHNVADWAAAWEQLVGTIQPRPGLPTIDFAQSVVVIAAMGRKPSGGYGIDVNEVRVLDGNATITVTESSPGEGCVVADIVTAPAAVTVSTRFDGDAKFVERTASPACH